MLSGVSAGIEDMVLSDGALATNMSARSKVSSEQWLSGESRVMSRSEWYEAEAGGAMHE